MTASGPRPSVRSRSAASDVVVFGQIDGLDVVAARHREPFRDEIDAEHASAAVAGDTGAHLTDGTETEHGDRPARGDRGVVDGLPGRGEHVGEKKELLVRRALAAP